MARCGAARAGRVASFDGLGNGFVLGVYLAGEVFASRLVGAGDTRHAAQELAQAVQRADQKGIAGRQCNGTVKSHILLGAVAAFAHRIVQRLHGLANAPQIGVAAARGSQRRHLGLQPRATQSLRLALRQFGYRLRKAGLR